MSVDDEDHGSDGDSEIFEDDDDAMVHTVNRLLMLNAQRVEYGELNDQEKPFKVSSVSLHDAVEEKEITYKRGRDTVDLDLSYDVDDIHSIIDSEIQAEGVNDVVDMCEVDDHDKEIECILDGLEETQTQLEIDENS